MRNLVLHSTVLAVVILSASTAWALDADTRLGKGVTVNGVRMPVLDILKSITNQVGAGLETQTAINGSLDISFTDVPLRTALTSVCSVSGLEWKEKRNGGILTIQVSAAKPADAEPANVSADKKVKSEAEAPKEAVLAEAVADEKTEKKKGLKLNQAQLMLIMQGVPRNRDRALLEYWKQKRGGFPRIYSPGVQMNVIHRPPVIMTPYGPYYSIPTDVKWYLPDGSVWSGYPYPSSLLKHPGKSKRQPPQDRLKRL